MHKQSISFLTVLSILTIFFMNQCTPGSTSPEFEEAFIVNGYLIVGLGVDSIFVSKSLSMDKEHAYNAAALSADSVLLSVDNISYRLLEYQNRPGAYYLPRDVLTVTPGKEYHLSVYIEDKTIRASTTAPDQIRIQSLNTDTTYYPYPDPEISTRFHLTWNATDYTAAYEISVIAHSHSDLIDWGLDQMTEHRLENYDNDTLRAFPPVSDFPVSVHETFTEVSWFAFCYYGDYTIKCYAIDENLWDLAASSVVYMPQSSEFEQPVYHLDGGLGIFAAVSVDSVHVHVKRQE